MNVWVTNTLNETTIDGNGHFEFEYGNVSDTILISYVEYEELQISPQRLSIVALHPNEIKWDEVSSIVMRNEQIKTINS